MCVRVFEQYPSSLRVNHLCAADSFGDDEAYRNISQRLDRALYERTCASPDNMYDVYVWTRSDARVNDNVDIS